jgi:hypothetical protein
MQFRHFCAGKPFVLIVCLCIAVTFVLSTWFINSHVDHDCIGDHCPICVQIQTTENLLKQINMSNISVPDVFSNLLLAFTLIYYINTYEKITNPITLKVKMNN